MSAQPGHDCLIRQSARPVVQQSGDACVLDQDLAWLRPLRGAVLAPWSDAVAQSTVTICPYAITSSRDTRARVPWRIALARAAASRLPWGITAARDTRRRSPWGRFEVAAHTPVAIPWGVAATADAAAVAPWGAYAGRPRNPLIIVWGTLRITDQMLAMSWGWYVPINQRAVAITPGALPVDRTWEIPWVRYSRPLDTGWGVVTPPGTPPTNEDGTIVVPQRRSYIVLNNVTLIRASNSLALTARTVQISIDAGTWTWGWSATMPRRHLADLDRNAPDEPVELEAQINGETWRLLVERIARNRSFGHDWLTVSGRGIAAQIADPYFPALPHDNTGGAADAQQLAAAALTINATPIGWALDWQIPDWLVPAGAWVHVGTPMDAVARIAQAAGGYVQADPYQQTLHVLPMYPAMPWEWAAATPDFELPAAATSRETTEYIELPHYNAVYVAGTALGGVLGHVKRAATAGDLHAGMVVDALITHADAARGRGRSILGNTGRQQRLTIETPILDAIGLYHVGSLIEWHEGDVTRRGIVRAVAVTAQLPRVRQTVEVEVHE